MKKTIIDTSTALLLHPFGNGVRLIRPDSKLKKIYEENAIPLNSIEEIFQLPLYVYFLDGNSVIQNINEKSIITCGYPSLKKSIGKTRHLVAKKETVEIITREDAKVIANKQMYIFEENFTRLDEINLPCIAFKFPWYDTNNKIIGLFGCSILPEQNSFNSMASSLALLVKLGLLNAPGTANNLLAILPDKQINDVYLSERELQCLHLLARGKTAKIIAKQLSLSYRTVEHHIENIKIKLNVHSKSELIDKFINYY